MQLLVHHQRHRHVHDHHREQLVGVGVPGEGTHFKDRHIIVHRFNLVLPVGDARDHYEWDYLELPLGFVHREGKAKIGRESRSYHIYTAINNRQEEHQSTVVE